MTYLVSTPGGMAVVVDPVEAAAMPVAAELDRRGTAQVMLLLTHEHFDHISGVNALRKRPGVRLACSKECALRIADPKLNFSRYLVGADYRCAPPDETFERLGGALEFGGLSMTFISTPGHSPGSACIAADGMLFTGDTLIRDTRTVTKLPGGNRQALASSIESVRRRFGPDTTVYPGHGGPFRLGETDVAVALKGAS